MDSFVIASSSRLFVVYVSDFFSPLYWKFELLLSFFPFFWKIYLSFFKAYSRTPRLNFHSKSPFYSHLSNTPVLCLLPNFSNILVKLFFLSWYCFNYRWKPWGNCFICWKCILFFNILLDNSMWFIILAIFCSQTTRRKRSFLQ